MKHSAEDIRQFAKDVFNYELFDAQVGYIQMLLDNDRIQLARSFGKTRAAEVAREIIRRERDVSTKAVPDGGSPGGA